MNRLISTAALLALLAGCGDGQPFEFDEDTGTPTTPGEDGGTDPDTDGLEGGPELPPGTSEPSDDDSIARYEPKGDGTGGYVESVTYHAGSDTFEVDNLAFDGANEYNRRGPVRSMGGYAVYEANETETDPRSGNPINQFDYRAIYGVSTDRVRVDGALQPRSRFAIVRSGSYSNYGFGGFVYERNGGVTLPENGQAIFSGDYAGIRVFGGSGGLEYTRGEISVAVDFEDFNDGNGVRGRVSSREAFSIDGTPVLTGGPGQLVLPDLVFDVGPNTTTPNGEISSGVRSYASIDGGPFDVYEEGNYYGIIGGDADEIVGIIVVESDDPRFDNVTAQETGGFIVYR